MEVSNQEIKLSHDKDSSPKFVQDEATAAKHRERLVPGEPLYPILSIEELPPTPDLRASLPPEIARYLRPEEKVVHIHEPEHIWPRRQLSALEVCMRAARAQRAVEIGYNGTTVASINIGDDDSKLSRYETQHGRDALQAANDLFGSSPKLLETEVVSLAESQGVEDEPYVPGQPYRQEKVGSIILVNRHPEDVIGQKFTRRLGWGFPYYGSVDAPALYIKSLARLHASQASFLARTKYKPRDRKGREEPISLAFDRTVGWLNDNADSHDGLIAYKNPIEGGGIRNQGWRDSANAMVHKSGEWADDRIGIAPIEVQGFAFDAWRDAGRIYRQAGTGRKRKEADELDERAWKLYKTVLDSGFNGRNFVSGFDWDEHGNLRQIDTLTSAAGRFLGSEMSKVDSPEMREMVRQTIFSLFGPDMLSKWGLRTLSSAEAIYVPFVYHNGVWTYDTNEVARSLSGHGYYGLDRVLGATTTHQHDKTGVFYEHVSGDDSAEEPIIPGQDVYVFNEKYQELYLWMLTPPPGQTWSASSEYAKHRRYTKIPPHATDPDKFKAEKQIWRSRVPDYVKEIVFAQDFELYHTLSN